MLSASILKSIFDFQTCIPILTYLDFGAYSPATEIPIRTTTSTTTMLKSKRCEISNGKIDFACFRKIINLPPKVNDLANLAYVQCMFLHFCHAHFTK